MARIKNERYGFISCEGESLLVQRMGVVPKNIWWINGYGELLCQLANGDTVCVFSVKSFAVSAFDLFGKLAYFEQCGINFVCENERFLNFSNNKPLQKRAVQVLRSIAYREQEFALWIQNSRLSADIKTVLINRIRHEFMTEVVLIFQNESVCKRGN